VQPVVSVYTVLVVEGRKAAAKHIAPLLDDQGYHIVTARIRKEAWAKVWETDPSVIVLDSPSLRFSSSRFCHDLKDSALEIPVLMLLAEDEAIDRGVGARAHLRYPLSTSKVVRRLDQLLDVLRMGDLVFSVKQRCVLRGGSENHLTPKQAHLLEIFMRHPGMILTRSYLMKQVWDTDYMGDTRTLDVHIHWVRKAIEEDHKCPVYLHTVRGVGYRFGTAKESERKSG